MKTRTQKEFFKLFYRAHRMADKGKNPMDVIADAVCLAYEAANDEVMMCRLFKAKHGAELALFRRERTPLSLSTRLSIHKMRGQL